MHITYGATSLGADHVHVVSNVLQPSHMAVSSTTQNRWNAIDSSALPHHEINTSILNRDNSAPRYEFYDKWIGRTVRIIWSIVSLVKFFPLSQTIF
jgi:hypothetical protein